MSWTQSEGRPVAPLTAFRHRGEAVQTLDLFLRAWDECVELQVTPRDEWVGRTLLSLQGLDRYEIAIHDRGYMLGALILAADPWDVHVGPCMSVFANYVLPEFRNKGIAMWCMREALRITREANINVLAFTHRKGPWRYETIYRWINNGVA